MGENVVLFEFADEVKVFINYCKERETSIEEFRLIALQPEVQVYLTKLNISYENTLKYFPNESHEKALLISESWYKFVENNIEIIDVNGVEEAYNNIYLFYLRFLINYFLLNLEVLKNLCENLDIDTLYSFSSEKERGSNDNPLIGDSERYLTSIVEKFARSNQIKHIKLPNTVMEVESKKSNVLVLFEKKIENFISRVYKRFFLSFKPDSKIILLLSTGYNMESLFSRLEESIPDVRGISISRERPGRAFIKYFFFRFQKFMGSSKGCNITPISLNQFRDGDIDLGVFEKNMLPSFEAMEKENLIFEKVIFYEVFEGKIKKDLIDYAKSFIRDNNALLNIFNHFNIKFCLSPVARETPLQTAELALKKGVSSGIISHGTLKVHENEFEAIEYSHIGESLLLNKKFKYAFLQNPSEEKFCNFFNRENTIKTGPLIFSKVDRQKRDQFKRSILGDLPPETKILIYPENTKPRASPRFHVFETFDEFLSSAADLIEAVNKIEDTHLVIRMHPGRDLTPEELISLLPESEKLTVTTSKRPFYELLSIADMVVGFSSTVIEDALQNHIPVLLLDKRGRYQHYKSETMEEGKITSLSPIYYIKDTSTLKDSVKWIVENHLTPGAGEELFKDFVYQEDYFENLVKFIKSKIE